MKSGEGGMDVVRGGRGKREEENLQYGRLRRRNGKKWLGFLKFGIERLRNNKK